MRYRSLCFLVLILLAAPAAKPATLLTNSAPIEFLLPAVPSGTLFAGDFGYAIYVPPGASRLTITLVPTNLDTYVVDLMVRHGVDPGLSGTGDFVYDHRTMGGKGVKQVEVHTLSTPALRAGTYYIGFNIVTEDAAMYFSLTATVTGGSILPVRTVAVSNFDQDLDGWVRNSSSTSLPGASQGEAASVLNWVAAGGNTGGYARFDEFYGTKLDALVAPAKFLGNLKDLPDGRFEFDFKILAGPVPYYGAEIRIFGGGAAFSWQGPVPPVPPDAPPEVQEGPQPCPPTNSIPPCPNGNSVPLPSPPQRWRRYSVLLQDNLWTRIAGTAGFHKVLANVERIEVIVDLSIYGEADGLDNFALLSRGSGPPQIVLPGNTSFTSGEDGWSRNFPASLLAGATPGDANSTLRWVPVEGNPGGYIRLTDAGGADADAFVVPSRFLGSLLGVSNPQIEFDYRHSSLTGASLPVEMRLIGAGSTFTWTGAVPARTWTHYVAPLAEDFWQRVTGTATLAAALANVERLEISADQAAGAEANGIDNFWLLPASTAPAPPAISANPLALTFVASMVSGEPAAQSLSVTSIGGGGDVTFRVAAASGGSSWLRVSAERGTTPLLLTARADVRGLEPGTYSGLITVQPLGQGVGLQTIPVTLALSDRPRPRPRISFPGGAVSAATGRTQLAPGGLGTLYGVWLGPTTPVRAGFVGRSLTLPTNLQGVRVLVNETYGALIAEAPVLYAGETQINFQLPFETMGRSEVLLVADYNGVQSEPHRVQVTSSSPGVFTFGSNRAVAVNEDNSVNAPENPAFRGSILTVYMTGQGVVTPPLPSGSAALSRPLTRAPLPSEAWIGGVSAQIHFIGLAPGLVGVLQVNLTVPEGAPSGDSPLMVNIGGWTSNAPLVTVQ